MTIKTNRRKVPPSSDCYYTPPWATHALMYLVSFDGLIWEPACGGGWMANVMKFHRKKVKVSDINPSKKFKAQKIDFLKSKYHAPNIVTNPPYSLLQEFIQQGLKLADRKLCLFVRLSALAGQTRYNEIYVESPPSYIFVFCERVTCYPYGKKTGGSGTTEYAWLIWDKRSRYYGYRTMFDWIRPGTREKFQTYGGETK